MIIELDPAISMLKVGAAVAVAAVCDRRFPSATGSALIERRYRIGAGHSKQRPYGALARFAQSLAALPDQA